MRKYFILFIASLIIVTAWIVIQSEEGDLKSLMVSPVSDGFKKLDKRTRMDLAIEQEVNRTRDPKLGYVPKNRLQNAYKFAEKKRKTSNKGVFFNKAITGVSWKERGPSNLGGRTRAIMIDPNDGTNQTVWSAGVSGGLWKTTNINDENPNWVSVNDFFENMAITSIAYDPSNTTTMYFGTGEGFFNVDAVEGNGIWKSTDGGVSWNSLANTFDADRQNCASSTANCNFLYVNKLVVTATGTILAATRSRFTNRGGVMRSTDGGANWSRVLTGSVGTNSCTGNDFRDWASDLEIAADGDLFVSFGIFEGHGIWRSQDDGATWTQVYTTPTPDCD